MSFDLLFEMLNPHSFVVTTVASDEPHDTFIFGLKWELGMSPFVSALTAVAVFIIGVKIVRILFKDDREPIRDSNKTHNWKNALSLQGVSIYLPTNLQYIQK